MFIKLICFEEVLGLSLKSCGHLVTKYFRSYVSVISEIYEVDAYKDKILVCIIMKIIAQCAKMNASTNVGIKEYNKC